MKKNVHVYKEQELTVDYNYIDTHSKLSFIGVYQVGDLDTCKKIINLFNQCLEQGEHLGFRIDDIDANKIERKDIAGYFVNDYNQDIKVLNTWLQIALDLYLQEYNITLPLESAEVKIHKVNTYSGGYHMWHSEQGPTEATAKRALSWMLYLNDINDNEGETEFLYQGIKIKPEAGKIVIWPAAFTHQHRGNPVYKTEKIYATGWLTIKYI